MSKPADPITVVIPVHNVTEVVDRGISTWNSTLEKFGRKFEILVVNDGSTDGTAAVLTRLAERLPTVRVLTNETQKGFGACLRAALVEAKHPLFFYTALDYPYTPTDLRPLLERIELRDEILKKQPDLISGCRTGLVTPDLVKWGGSAWKVFWRVFAGMPITDPMPWHGWPAFWYAFRMRWIYAIPLADVNSCFKLYRTEFLRKIPIQSDGDFVHVELVAKATFLTSIMDEVPLTPKPDEIPQVGAIGADSGKVFRNPEFLKPEFIPEAPKPPPPAPAPVAAPPKPDAPNSSTPNSPAPGSPEVSPGPPASIPTP